MVENIKLKFSRILFEIVPENSQNLFRKTICSFLKNIDLKKNIMGGVQRFNRG